MYCPNCGAESTFGLNYCKQCGASLAETTQSATTPNTRNTLAALILALATVAIVLGGLGIVFTHALALVGPQPPEFSPPGNAAGRLGPIMVIFGSAAVAFVAFMLIRLFSHVMGLGADVEKASRQAKKLVPQRKVAQIPAPPIVVSSVTEHTTRNFAPPRAYQRDTRE